MGNTNNKGRAAKGTPPHRKHTIEYVEEVQPDDTDNPEDLELSGWLSTFGSGASAVKLYRLDEASGKFRWRANLETIGLDEQVIASRFGAGTFLIRTVKADGHKWGPSRVVHIDPEAAGVDPASTAFVDPAADLLRLQLAAAQQELQLAREETRASTQRQHELMLTIAKGSNRPVGPQETVASLIAGLQGLQGLSGAQRVHSPTELLKLILDTAERFADRTNSEKPDGWTELLRTFGPLLVAGSTASVADRTISTEAPADRMPAVTPRPGEGGELSKDGTPATVPGGATPPVMPHNSLTIVGFQLRQLLEQLKSQKAAGVTPALVLNTLVNLDESKDPLAGLILSSLDKSADFASWLTWLHSMTDAEIDTKTSAFLEALFQAVKAMPVDEDNL